MSIFFVLSGFIITYTYYDFFRKNPSAKASWKFFIARFARLYPLYLFTTVSMILLLNQGVPTNYFATGFEFISFITLTQSWFNFQHVINASAWSISTECFFYLMFVLCMIGLSSCKMATATAAQIKRRAVAFTIIFLMLLYGIFIFRDQITDFLTPYIAHRNNSLVWSWISYFSPPIRLGEFIIGALAARLYMVSAETSQPKGKKKHHYFFVVSIACIILLIFYNITHLGYDTYLYFLTSNFGFAPFIAYILYASCRYPGRFTQWCSHRWMVAGGEISYSLYMMQFIIFFWPFYNLFPKPQWYEITTSEWFIVSFSVLFYIVLVTFVAIITYRWIELPSRRYIRKKFDV